MLYAFINIDIYKHVPAYHRSIIFPFRRNETDLNVAICICHINE